MLDYHNEPHGVYLMIDNKSFFASIESVQRGIDPLDSVLLVMAEHENNGSGLVVATSPLAKKHFGIRNVDRGYKVPSDARLLTVPPRLALYRQKNRQINQIFRRYADADHWWPYSIDESILDLSDTWPFFGATPEKAAAVIQRAVFEELGLRTTVGIGENPLQAKLALDLFAKHAPNFQGRLSYHDFAARIWPRHDLTNIWSIGKKTAAKLNLLGINSVGDLAHTDPHWLKHEFGVAGTHLYALAWGIDRTDLSVRLTPKNPSWSSSQVMPKDLSRQKDIEQGIIKVANDVIDRLSRHHQKAGRIRLGLGYANGVTDKNGRTSYSHEITIEPTAERKLLTDHLLGIFHQAWSGAAVRNISIALSRLSDANTQQISLF
ncbi:excinuclease ABC subunit A [Limosilactobacillus mucosae]|uniref:Y-family DNA polymerase n=1 Tax=Limosilactobacillus mucosae TaxID=97478 RepID=UPI0022DEFE0E|nr:excinuclease ABC subunit A [Limosilactobacillus mucosae]